MLNVERSVSPDRLAGTRAPPVPSDLRFQIYDFGRDPQFQFSAFQRFSICPEISAFCFPFSDLVSGQWSVVRVPLMYCGGKAKRRHRFLDVATMNHTKRGGRDSRDKAPSPPSLCRRST